MIINRLQAVRTWNSFYKFLFIGCLLLGLSSASLRAQISGDSHPPEYQGFRLFASQMSLGKIKADQTEVKVTLINTGREVFKLQPALMDKLVIKFDPSWKKVLAQVDSIDFIKAIFNSGITLSPGQIEKGKSLKVKPTPKKLIIPEAEVVTLTPIEEEATPIEEEATPIEEEVPEKKNKKQQSEINPATLAGSENEIIPAPTAEVISQTDTDTKKEDSDNPTIAQPKAILEAEEIEATTVGCADLILEDLKVIKQNKNSVILAYSLRNIGVGPVDINGEGSDEGLALRGHLSSSDQLSRGALTIGGKFVKANAEDAIIPPGESYLGNVKLPLHKLTKFTPYLILQVDPYQMIMECDETNNLQFINLIPDSPMSKTTDQ